MPRLLRPHIPLEVRCRVALRQLGEMWPDSVLEVSDQAFGKLLADLLAQLAGLLGCAVTGLHLDHNPALGARAKVIRKGVHVGYRPAANDPEHLLYREKHAHHIKTNVRGDGAQHPDRVLIKRERRRERASGSPKKPSGVKRATVFRTKVSRPKTKWPKRSFPKKGKSK